VQDYSLILKRREQAAEGQYRTCLQAVLEQTAEPDYPMGVIPWLESAEPGLYQDVTGRLPDLIHDLWTAHAPLPVFERVTGEWLAAHRRACALFRSTHRQKTHKGTEGVRVDLAGYDSQACLVWVECFF
jgi:hypothetical protein